MNKALLLPLAAAALAIGACDADFGEGAGSPDNTSAEGTAQDNQMSISAPGFEMKVDLPEGVRREANFDSDNDLFYPGAKLAGMHIQANDGGGVELRFTTPDAPDKVSAWYRDPARTEFKIGDENRDGVAIRLQGITGDNDAPFKLSLSPAGSGTEGVLTISDRN
jgi:hypothetical protein